MVRGAAWTHLELSPGRGNPLAAMQMVMRFLGALPPDRPSGDHVALVYALGTIVDGKGDGVLGAREQIAPGEHGGDGLQLDGCRLCVAGVGDRAQQRIGQAEACKCHFKKLSRVGLPALQTEARRSSTSRLQTNDVGKTSQD